MIFVACIVPSGVVLMKRPEFIMNGLYACGTS